MYVEQNIKNKNSFYILVWYSSHDRYGEETTAAAVNVRRRWHRQRHVDKGGARTDRHDDGSSGRMAAYDGSG